MILWRNTENYHDLSNYHFDSDPRFPPFLLYIKWKSGVTFVRRCFRIFFFFIRFSIVYCIRLCVVVFFLLLFFVCLFFLFFFVVVVFHLKVSF